MSEPLFNQALCSKLFLIGEYAACNHGCGILINFMPKFKLALHNGSSYATEPIYAMLQSSYPKTFDDLTLEIDDPYQKIGGFGRSSAVFRFLGEYLLKCQQLKCETLEEWYSWYLQFAWQSQQGLQPSGLDFLSQHQKGIVSVDRNSNSIQLHDWLYDEVDMIICQMQPKIITHEHLNKIENHDFDALHNYTLMAQNALTHKKLDKLISALEQFQKQQIKQNLVHPNTLNVLDDLKSVPFIVHARGCGALGADVMLVLTKKSKAHTCIPTLRSHPKIVNVLEIRS